MIELTPLDVRKKRGDFRRTMRGFDPAEVDSFIELVAERMESLVTENLTLKERAARLQDQVREQGDRERAVQEALVTAQELRKDISGQAHREAELIKREAEAEIERMLLDAEHRAEELRSSAAELERRRRRFLRTYLQYLQRELDDVTKESGRSPLDEPPLELNLDGISGGAAAAPAATSGDTDPSGDDDPGLAADQLGDASAGAPDSQEIEAGAPNDSEGNGEAVAVESLAPEAEGVEEAEMRLGWPGTARLPTQVGSDRAGDPDAL